MDMGEEDPKYPKEKKLVTITEYAVKWGLNRHTVYKQLEDGKITRYLDKDGNPLLDPEEAPKDVRAYQDRPEYPENGEK